MFYLRMIGRLVGIVLVLVGLFVLVFAGMNYVQTTSAERQAEARVPGQDSGAITPVPTLVAQATRPPTATPTAVASPTIPPSETPQPTTPAPTATPTVQMVVGSQGLPRGKGVDPVRIVIPRMKLDTNVEVATWDVVDQNGSQVSEWQIPYDAVGNLTTTARPGEAGNAVISGHNNLIGPNQFGVGLFAGLWNLKVNDPVYVTDSLGRTFLYQVQKYYYVQELGEPQSVREQHAQQMLADDGTPILTMETCWNGPQAPLSGNTYRWVVVSRLVGTVDASQIPTVK